MYRFLLGAVAACALMAAGPAAAQEKITVFWNKGFYKAEDDALFAAVTLAGLDPLLAIPLAGVLAAIVAAILGPLMFRLDGPYFAIGTWVVAEALRLGCAQFKPLGGGTGMSLSGAALANMTGTKWAGALFGIRAAAARDVVVYWIALVLVLAITFAIYAFVRSGLGLGLAASRDNDALRIEAMQQVVEALALLPDAVRVGNEEVLDEDAVRIDRGSAHLGDPTHLDLAAIELGNVAAIKVDGTGLR